MTNRSVRKAAKFGVQVPSGTPVDFGKAMERMRRLRAEISPHDSAQRFIKLGIDVFLGEAKFTDPDTIVGGDKLRFAKALIATGARTTARICSLRTFMSLAVPLSRPAITS